MSRISAFLSTSSPSASSHGASHLENSGPLTGPSQPFMPTEFYHHHHHHHIHSTNLSLYSSAPEENRGIDLLRMVKDRPPTLFGDESMDLDYSSDSVSNPLFSSTSHFSSNRMVSSSPYELHYGSHYSPYAYQGWPGVGYNPHPGPRMLDNQHPYLPSNRICPTVANFSTSHNYSNWTNEASKAYGSGTAKIQSDLKMERLDRPEKPPGKVELGSTETKAKLFTCCSCNKQYCRRGTLKAHMKQHIGEKPFVCLICGKSFSQSANLAAHRRVHTGEKPFRCSVCYRPFSQSSSLVTHKRLILLFRILSNMLDIQNSHRRKVS